MSHLASKGDFNTSEIRAINWCHMYKGIFFIRNICNHKGIYIQKSATDTVITFNMIHDFNWTRKYHTTIAAWGTWKKAMINLCDESRDKLRTLLGKWRPVDNKYIPYWQWFLSRDLYTLYYIGHRTWCNHTRTPNRARRHNEYQTYTKSISQWPSCYQVWRISLTSSTTTHIQIKATGM